MLVNTQHPEWFKGPQINVYVPDLNVDEGWI